MRTGSRELIKYKWGFPKAKIRESPWRFPTKNGLSLFSLILHLYLLSGASSLNKEKSEALQILKIAMDTDEAYHSGLSLPTAGEDFKKDEVLESRDSNAAATESGSSGANPLAGTPPKERSAMSKLFTGKQSAESSKDPGTSSGSAEDPIKSAPKAKLNLTGTPVAITPLAGRFQSISFQPQGGCTLSTDSPTSDYGSGNFPSLADSGFSSMPSMPSLEKQDKPAETAAVPPSSRSNATATAVNLITGDDCGQRMEVDSAPPPIPQVSIYSADPTPPTGDSADTPPSKMEVGGEATVSSFVPARKSPSSEAGSYSSRESNSMSPGGPMSMLVHSAAPPTTAAATPTTTAAVGVVRSDSPGVVPVVGEDVEIETESSATCRVSASGITIRGQRQEGAKRSAMDSDLAAPTSKNPRLSPEVISK